MTCSLVCDAASIIPEIDFSCGIIPYPKYDEAQADYRSFLQRSCYSLIPSTADADFSGALLEAWSSEAYRSVTPEYFEISLKTRYSQDNDASRMFDLIRSSINFDLGEIFGNSIGTPSSLFRDTIAKNNVNWASVVASNEQKWQGKLDELWDAMTNG